MRSLPNASEPLNEGGRPSVPYYGWFSELWRKLKRLWFVDDGQILFMDGDAVAGATVGTGLTLDRTTNTLSATGEPFPEAPQDGAIYGRMNASWTQVISGATTDPADPDTSIQFNNGGVFGGTEHFTIDTTNDIIYVGRGNTTGPAAYLGWTIKPKDQETDTTYGRDLTIQAGKNGDNPVGSGNDDPGTLRLKGAESGYYNGVGIAQSGDVEISTPDAPLLGSNYRGGDIRLTIGTSRGAGGGGNIEMVAGNCTTNTAGSITLTAGAASTGPGGSVNLRGGASGASGAAGGVTLRGGAADGIQNGGMIDLYPGTSSAGSDGRIRFFDADGSVLGGQQTVMFGDGTWRFNAPYPDFNTKPSYDTQFDGTVNFAGAVTFSGAVGATLFNAILTAGGEVLVDDDGNVMAE